MHLLWDFQDKKIILENVFKAAVLRLRGKMPKVNCSLEIVYAILGKVND